MHSFGHVFSHSFVLFNRFHTLAVTEALDLDVLLLSLLWRGGANCPEDDDPAPSKHPQLRLCLILVTLLSLYPSPHIHLSCRLKGMLTCCYLGLRSNYFCHRTVKDIPYWFLSSLHWSLPALFSFFRFYSPWGCRKEEISFIFPFSCQRAGSIWSRCLNKQLLSKTF